MLRRSILNKINNSIMYNRKFKLTSKRMRRKVWNNSQKSFVISAIGVWQRSRLNSFSYFLILCRPIGRKTRNTAWGPSTRLLEGPGGYGLLPALLVHRRTHARTPIFAPLPAVYRVTYNWIIIVYDVHRCTRFHVNLFVRPYVLYRTLCVYALAITIKSHLMRLFRLYFARTNHLYYTL